MFISVINKFKFRVLCPCSSPRTTGENGGGSTTPLTCYGFIFVLVQANIIHLWSSRQLLSCSSHVGRQDHNKDPDQRFQPPLFKCRRLPTWSENSTLLLFDPIISGHRFHYLDSTNFLQLTCKCVRRLFRHHTPEHTAPDHNRPYPTILYCTI